MTDIVERLINIGPHVPLELRKEAADEIERLRGLQRDTALRLLNVASCLDYGMAPNECAAEIRLIVERAAVQPDAAP
jgi:hypothetical protein